MLPKSILVALAWSVVSGNSALAAPFEQDTPKWTSLLTDPAEESTFNEAAFEKRADAPDYCSPISTDIYGGHSKDRYEDITPGTTHLSQQTVYQSHREADNTLQNARATAAAISAVSLCDTGVTATTSPSQTSPT
jgi:hypothetical protein